MKKAVIILVLALLAIPIVLCVGCGQKGLVDVAKECVKGEGNVGFRFANASMDYKGEVSVTSKKISAAEGKAEITLEASDGSRRWTLKLVQEDGKWKVVDGKLKLMKGVKITI